MQVVTSPTNRFLVSVMMPLPLTGGITPPKTNMEPEKHLFEEENNLLKLHFWVPAVSFRGSKTKNLDTKTTSFNAKNPRVGIPIAFVKNHMINSNSSESKFSLKLPARTCISRRVAKIYKMFGTYKFQNVLVPKMLLGQQTKRSQASGFVFSSHPPKGKNNHFFEANQKKKTRNGILWGNHPSDTPTWRIIPVDVSS